MSDLQEYVVGDRLVVTSGAYSDYHVVDTYTVLRDFCYDCEVSQMGFPYVDNNGSYKGGYRTFKPSDVDDIAGILEASGFIERFSHKELYLGDYDGVDALLSDIKKFSSGS